jgi:hypothetical protein
LPDCVKGGVWDERELTNELQQALPRLVTQLGERSDSMAARIRLVTVVALALGVLFWPSTIRAQGASPVEVGSGAALEASGWGVDDTGCIETVVDVDAYDFATSAVLVYISRSDVCAQTQLFSGSAWLDPADPGVETWPERGTATVRVSVPLFDWVSQSNVVADLDLTWNGTGERVRDRYVSHAGPGCSFFVQDTGTWEAASVTGSIAVGETEFMPGPIDGSINGGHFVSMVINCS